MSAGGDVSVASERIASLVQKYRASGQDLTTDARLAEAVLLDAFPDSPTEVVRALVEAVRCDAVRQLEESASSGAALAISLSSSYLASNSGLREDLCRWATAAWWSALFPESPPSEEVTRVFSPWQDAGAQTLGLGIAKTEGPTTPVAGPPPAQTLPRTPAGSDAARGGGALSPLTVFGAAGAAVILVASVVLQKALYIAGSRAGQVVGALVIVAAAALVLGLLVRSRSDGRISLQWFVFDSIALAGAAAVMVGSLLMAWLFVTAAASKALIRGATGRTPLTLHDAGYALAIRWLVPIIAAGIVVEVLIANRWALWPHRSFLAIIAVLEAVAVGVALSTHGFYGSNTSHGKGAWLALVGTALVVVAALGQLIPAAPAPAEVTFTQ